MIAVFEKSERLRHIGHLDIQRAVMRALRRSGLPVSYSKGFNPHILLTFASALSTVLPAARRSWTFSWIARCPRRNSCLR